MPDSPFASCMLALTGILFSLKFLWLLWDLDQVKKKERSYFTLITFSILDMCKMIRIADFTKGSKICQIKNV